MVIKNTFLAIVISGITLASCTRPVSLNGEVLYLVNPEVNNKQYQLITCVFTDREVQMFALKDTSTCVADVTVGSYSTANNVLKFPKGSFDLEKTSDGYALYQKGRLKCQLLSQDAYKLYQRAKLEPSL